MLTNTPINFSGIKTLPSAKEKDIINLPKLLNDCFVKSGNNIAFKGNQSENDFINWYNETDFKIEDIKNIITETNLMIGKGNSNSVFKFPNCDDFVIRIYTSNISQINECDWNKAKIIDIQDKNLSLNIGQALARIEVPTNHAPITIEILKKQEGEPIGIKPSEAMYYEDSDILKEGELPYEDISRVQKYSHDMSAIAQLPQESFDKLIADFKEAHKCGYYFDYLNSNNLLLDKNNQKINLVDMSKGNAEASYDGLLYALTNSRYFGTHSSSQEIQTEEKFQTLKDDMEIIGKFFTAMQNNGVKFNREHFTFQAFKDLICGMPMSYYFKTNDTEEKCSKMEKMGILIQ